MDSVAVQDRLIGMLIQNRVHFMWNGRKTRANTHGQVGMPHPATAV